MPERVDVVYLSCCEKWWRWQKDGFVSRPAQIARALAAHPGVRSLLVVDAPSSVSRLAVPSAEEPEPRLGLTPVAPGVHVLDQMRLLPRERHWPLAYRVNGRLHEQALVRGIERAASQLGLEDPVFWLTGPLVLRTALAFEGVTVAYDAMDEWLALPEMRSMRGEIADSYERIRERADLVFAVSEALCDRFRGAAPSVHLVPNAVDSARFGRPGPVPADLLGIPGPRVGYVGMLQDRIDVELVARLARLMPDVSFVFVGPVLDAAHFVRLREVPNVHFLGARSASIVPAYLAAFDACFLPHRSTELTRNMDPLKLYEYVAAGKPAVASDVAFVQPEALVRRARSAEQLAGYLRDALDGTWVPDAGLRRRHMAQATWPARVTRMLGHIESSRARGGVATTPRAMVSA